MVSTVMFWYTWVLPRLGQYFSHFGVGAAAKETKPLTYLRNPTAKSFFCYFPNSTLISATDGAARIFPTTLIRNAGIRTHDPSSRVAPDWDLSDPL